MDIGIGYTTFKRDHLMKVCYDKILEHTFDTVEDEARGSITHTPKDGNNYHLYIAKDTVEDRKGVAARKNECLRALKHCDYIFLFDDDCHPSKDGWAKFFIDSGADHLLYLNETHGINTKLDNIEYFNECGGVFMFMSRKGADKVGAFCEDYDTWGFEHAGYSVRLLGERHKFPMLKGTSEYIYAMDYDKELGLNSTIKNNQKQSFIEKNLPIFVEDCKTTYLPL